MVSLDRLRNFEIVLVTGPQRSGTTIAGRIVAHELGLFSYVDEEIFDVHDYKMLAHKMVVRQGQIVIQCPAVSRWIVDLAGIEPDKTIVVWMMRDVSDIIASQKRIGWDSTKEREKYADIEIAIEKDRYPICEIKRLYWERYQRPLVKHSMTVDYSDLSGHELWIKKNQRKSFGSRQWK